jgi:peptidoglycan glycosyltransferase
VNKQISRVALFALLLLAALIVSTTYWQTWASGGLADRQDNALQRVAEFEIKRGLIYASDGKTVLAENRSKKVAGQTLYFRHYPRYEFAAQTLGYSTQSRSRAGIEQQEDPYLTGSETDLGGLLDKVGDDFKGSTITGDNLTLTLNVKEQTLAQSLLRGKCAAAVVLNPQTGAVLAMASSPTYDPNLIEEPSGYEKIERTASPCAPESASPLLNRATQGLFPPGSTFKTITAAAALDDGVYTPSSTFYDPGYCTEYGQEVKNALDQSGPEAYGEVNLAEAYQHSINAVFCKIGIKLGAQRVLDEAKKFGFYSTPPLQIPNDERSPSGCYKNSNIFDPKDADTAIDPGRLAFGQACMLATPLQMALVAAGIANGGKIMRPTLIKRITSPSGSTLAKLKPHVWKTATKPSTAAAITSMMVEVVQGGTGIEAQIPGVTVAGKTGTAEICTGCTDYDAWFIFFAPAEHPTVAGAVVVERQENGFGGAISAPIAKQLMQAILPKPSKANP